MPKIALFIPSLRGGGAERVWVTLANEFAKRSYDVDLLLAEKAGPYLELVSDKVNIVDFQKGRVLTSLFPLVRYLKKNKPVALLSAMNHANLVAIWASLIARTKTKVVVSVRYSMRNYGSSASQIKKMFEKLLVVVFFRFAHAITTVSKGVKTKTTEIIPKQQDKIFTIYNPILEPGLQKQMLQKATHPWLNEPGKPNKPPVVLAAGRLAKVKGYDMLIQAFAKVKSTADGKLIILGEGNQRRELQNLINNLNLENDVDLFGFVDNPFPFMKQADLFVLSSSNEGLPGALVQAMACGTPVVATDCTYGPSEILEEGKWGILVPVGDSDKMAEAILRSLKKTEHPDVAVRAAFFNVSNCVDRYIDIIKN